METNQKLVDEAFRKIWIGLGLTILAIILYAITSGNILRFPGFGLVGAFMLASTPVNAKDDYIQSLNQSACHAVVWFFAVYLLGLAILSVTDLTFSVEFGGEEIARRRSIEGLFGFYLDGLLVALVAALVYYSTFIVQNMRRST